MQTTTQEIYTKFHNRNPKGLSCRLRQYIQDCLLFDSEPVDWSFIRTQCRTAEEADQICTDIVQRTNLTVVKYGKEFKPSL